MRKFYLINESNARFDLQDIKNDGYINNPTGLGYDNGYTYTRVGNLYKRDNSELKQAVISGTIKFAGYEKYQEFIEFIESSEELRLIYKPVDVEYFRDIDMSSIEKTELKGHWLSCNVKFSCKGLYYTESDKRFVVEELSGEARYPIRFDASFNDYSSVSIDYNNQGHVHGEFIAEIYGYTEQPKIELYVNGTLKYSVKFNITIEDGQKLIYSAKNGDNFVYLEDENGVQTNIISCLSLDNDNFYKIPKGYSTIKATSQTGTMNKIVFRILTAYKGV